MVQANGSRTSDVITTTQSGTDISHDHARDALRLALGSILAPKRYTPNPMHARSASSSGTASPAHFPLPGSPSPAHSGSSASQSQTPHHSSHSHPAFPHPHQHIPHVHSHLVPGREQVAHAMSPSTSSSTSHSPHSSLPTTPITEISANNNMSSPSPFNHYPRPGMLSRSISSSSTHSIPSVRPSPAPSASATTGANGSVGTDSTRQLQSGGTELDSERLHMQAPSPRLSNSDRSPVPVPAVAVTTPGGTPIGKNKFIQTLEGKTHSAWEALIHGSFS